MNGFHLDIRYRRRTRRATIKLLPDRQIRITVPYGVTEKQIHEILQEKIKWIHRRYEILESMPMPKKIQFVENEALPFMGEELILKILPGQKQAVQNANYIYASDIESLQTWYRMRAIEKISERVPHFAQLLGVKYRAVTIKNYKARWGACSAKGELVFNWQIVCFEPDLFDYVVAHEICHLKEMNHGPRFYRHLSTLGFERSSYHARMRPLKNFF